MNQNQYDIIGDIHGHSEELEDLLSKLGYAETDGVYRHECGRRAVFVGDYIDRGPAIRRVLQIVRAMVETGSGMAILGNHEVNALRYHTRDADGAPLRPQGSKNKAQHKATLDQLADPAPDEWSEWMRWFGKLPLWLDLGNLRVVHAAWDEAAMNVLRDVGPLAGPTLERFSQKGTPDHNAISRLINGPEAGLADGEGVVVQRDSRKEIRVRWWEATTFDNARDAIYPSIPDIRPLPIEPYEACPYPTDAPPVFFGHYATTLDQALVAPNAACLDLGIGKGGCLSAYRWNGEAELSLTNLVTSRRA